MTVTLCMGGAVALVFAGLFSLDPNGGGWHKVKVSAVIGAGLLLAAVANHFVR